MKLIEITAVLTIFCTRALAGGVVGNGAGLVEQNIQFVYLSLPKIISNCVAESNRCPLTSDEVSLVLKVKDVIRQNSMVVGRIQFASEKQTPGFFTTSSTENNRIAKTGLDSSAPIFINVDELYNSNEKPAIDFSGIAAILVHEIGHQTGETSHQKLDILGAKIRIFLNYQFSSLDYTFENSEVVQINIVNYPMPSPIGDLYVSFGSGASMQLTPRIIENLSCTAQGQTLVGFNIVNSHWNHVFKGRTDLIDFEAWLEVFCQNSSDGTLTTSDRDFFIRIDDQARLLKLEVR